MEKQALFEHMEALMLLLDELVDGGYDQSHDTVLYCFLLVLLWRQIQLYYYIE